MQAEPCCCPAGSWPALQEAYVAKGQTITLQNVSVYHIGSGQKALVIISDIFGATSGRHQSIADTFADLGYNVFIPEILENPYNGPIEMGPIIATVKAQSQELIQLKFQQLVNYLHAHEINKFYSIGFCWGQWQAFKLAAKHDEFICIAGMHPSMGVEDIFGGNQLELTKSIKCPAFLYPAQNDPENVKVGGELVEALKAKFGVEKTGSLEFPQMIHGWVPRGDLKDEKVYRDVEKALKEAHSYFKLFQ